MWVLQGHIAKFRSTTAAAQAKSSNHYLAATRSHKHASRKKGPAHGANLFNPCQSSPLRNEPDTNRVCSEPKHITWIVCVSSSARIGSAGRTDVSLPAVAFLVNSRAKRWANFEPTFWKEIVPLVKWWTAKATKPNNSPLSFLAGLLLNSFLSLHCCYWSWPLTWPARRRLVWGIFPVSRRLNGWANRMWPHRQETC